MWIFESIFVPLLSGSAAAGAVALLLDRRKITWNTKRDACLEALEIVSGLMSRATWNQDGKELPTLRQPPPRIEDIRRCHNQLAITCRRPEVLEAYLKCFNFQGTEGGVKGDAIDDLRDAVRRELGLRRKLERDRNLSFIGFVSTAAGAQGEDPASGAQEAHS